MDEAIKELIALAPNATDAQQGAEQTDAANLALVDMEIRALELVRQGNRAEAGAILRSTAYEDNKRVYGEGISRTTNDIRTSLSNRIVQLRDDRKAGLAML